jgi:hypothetical protein
MNIPFNLKRMLDTELHFPQRFTNMVQKNYGLIYFNEGNKNSWDSNHAVITDLIGVESSVRDIESFYKSKGINPRVFCSYQQGELDKLRPSLENHEYTIEMRPDKFFVHDHESALKPVPGMRIQRVRNLTIDIMETIAMEFGGDFTIRGPSAICSTLPIICSAVIGKRKWCRWLRWVSLPATAEWTMSIPAALIAAEVSPAL